MIGVAGFVVPGTRVDVMAVIAQAGGSLARVVVSNVQVLAAGTRYDQQAARDGKPVPSSVVTLLVTPEDAELVGLASNQGTLLLTLRNPLDTQPTMSPGTRSVSLTGRCVCAGPIDWTRATRTTTRQQRASANSTTRASTATKDLLGRSDPRCETH